MHRVMLPCVAATVILVAQFQIFAQPVESGSISSGREIAITICGNCHKIDHAMSARAAVCPKFRDIANLPSTSALSLRVFLRSKHNQMSNFIISKAATDDVIAYILSLKRQ
jgi:mono/diheme cytochrome c family protein